MVSFSFSVAPWRYYLRQEPDAVMPHVRIRAGGRPRGRFLPRHVQCAGQSRQGVVNESFMQ
jgi:hypothetical protein